MDVIDAIRSRRSVRFFKEGDEISKADLRAILESGRYAPSAKNLQPIEYMIVSDAVVRKQLSKACNQDQPSKAPAVVMVLGNLQISAKLGEISSNPNSTSYRSTHMFIHMDAAAAIENMLLTATSMGIDSLWISSFADNDVHAALELPGHIIPLAILCFGHRTRPPFSPHKRPIDERTYHDRYKGKSQDLSYLGKCRLINSKLGEYKEP